MSGGIFETSAKFLNQLEFTNMEDFVADSLEYLHSRPSTEADVKANIMRPVLVEVLNFSPREIYEESQSYDSVSTIRPDYRCGEGNSFADVILEAKKLGVDIYRRRHPDEPTNKYPLGQLANYLTHYEMCGHGTIGLLSNGVDWAVLANVNNKVLTLDKFSASTRFDLESSLLKAVEKARKIVGHIDKENKPEKSSWINVLRELEKRNKLINPTQILLELNRTQQYQNTEGRQSGTLLAEGLPENIAAIEVGTFSSKYSDLFGDRKIYQMCIRPDTYDKQISSDDITNCLHDRTVRAVIDSRDRCFGIAYSVLAPDSTKLRGFVWTGNDLQVTDFFDLNLPKEINVRRLNEISKYSYTESSISIPSMSLETLHKEFHEEIGEWFSRTKQTDNELRHLVRILFVWLLYDRGLVPEGVLPLHIPDAAKPTAIHKHLEWLFTEILAKPMEARSNRSNDLNKCVLGKPIADALVRETPFLNGSIFHKLNTDQCPQTLVNEFYLSSSDNPGLFDILARYQWTLSENSAYMSEIAIDPNMLGELFERLILRTEGIRYERSGQNLKMPDGTYFTPSDVVDEMVADAFAHWMHNRLPKLSISELRQLVHPTPDVGIWEEWSNQDKNHLIELLRSVTVLDPCCGSGAFTVASMLAISRIERRLQQTHTQDSILARVIEKQIFAIDKKSLAAAISKLRIYIAIVEEQLRRNPNTQLMPLPNLEVRVIVANTLRMDMNQAQATLFRIDDDQEWRDGISQLNANRELWTHGAFDESEKTEIRKNDQLFRQSLLEFVERNSHKYVDVDTKWLEQDMMQEPRDALELDVRNCFLRNHWDIVIGNPPYQIVKKKDRIGYGNGYLTEGCNLYTLFLEVALKLVAEDGTVTFVIPHSIVFRRQKKYVTLRKTLESSAKRISYRTYDNRPQPLFPRLPWLRQDKENRQRATILTLDLDVDRTTKIYSNGYIRLRGGGESVIRC